MFRGDFVIVKEDIPRSHTEVVCFQDDNSCVSTGSGGSHDDHRPTVGIRAKKLYIYILGGQTLLDHLKPFPKEMWWRKALAFGISLQADKIDELLLPIFEDIRRNAFEDGRASFRSDYRKLFEVE